MIQNILETKNKIFGKATKRSIEKVEEKSHEKLISTYVHYNNLVSQRFSPSEITDETRVKRTIIQSDIAYSFVVSSY